MAQHAGGRLSAFWPRRHGLAGDGGCGQPREHGARPYPAHLRAARLPSGVFCALAFTFHLLNLYRAAWYGPSEALREQSPGRLGQLHLKSCAYSCLRMPIQAAVHRSPLATTAVNDLTRFAAMPCAGAATSGMVRSAGVAQCGRALPKHGRGRGFESYCPLQTANRVLIE